LAAKKKKGKTNIKTEKKNVSDMGNKGRVIFKSPVSKKLNSCREEIIYEMGKKMTPTSMKKTTIAFKILKPKKLEFDYYYYTKAKPKYLEITKEASVNITKLCDVFIGNISLLITPEHILDTVKFKPGNYKSEKEEYAYEGVPGPVLAFHPITYSLYTGITRMSTNIVYNNNHNIILKNKSLIKNTQTAMENKDKKLAKKNFSLIKKLMISNFTGTNAISNSYLTSPVVFQYIEKLIKGLYPYNLHTEALSVGWKQMTSETNGFARYKSNFNKIVVKTPGPEKRVYKYY
jgi:hypothetical protein